MKGETYLKKPGQFALVYNEGKAWTNSILVMKALSSQLELSRYGFSISKHVGNAVVRNRLKRLLREVLRSEPVSPGWDIVFIGRSKAASSDYKEIKSSVETLLSRAHLLKCNDEGSGIRSD